ncbi:MAG TPA: hypothetical protein VKB34_12255 [Povalibacter sp.]|nr:hypothetical protein [Povalibacter sp.]
MLKRIALMILSAAATLTGSQAGAYEMLESFHVENGVASVIVRCNDGRKLQVISEVYVLRACHESTFIAYPSDGKDEGFYVELED